MTGEKFNNALRRDFHRNGQCQDATNRCARHKIEPGGDWRADLVFEVS
ncbi:hypothetical protein RR42_m2303 [Cupriavidus basilensis]|uniref:Uncharacterized protein n=1 Tax=Cupriavidus basilensis TaxID=68895 RepID=A0A0C4Y9S8_9BURK|nr:hypothetical protein RR42_m2303 [Cupriavidus basilensis]